MADNEKKKSKKSKAAFMFAFAATVLSSRAASLAASAAPVVDTDDINMPTANNVQADIGTTVDYQKIASNVYIANESSPEMRSFQNVLSETRNYGVFAENFNMNTNGNHVEANVCAKKIRNVDAQYDNILAHSPDKAADAKLTWYLGAPPESTDIRLTVNSDKKYELVLGFAFEEISYDNGHGIGFKADGKEYHIECGGKAENVSIVREDRNIASSLDNIAEQGNRLMLAADFESDKSDKSLFNAVSAILMDQVTRGQTLMVNVHANDLASNSGYIGNLLKCNEGVNVIINIMTDPSVKNIDLGRCSDDTWLETDGRVTFNFGTFNGTISTDKNAGTIVAPYASFVNRENFHGNVVAMSVDMGNELYQDLDNLTSTAPAVPSVTPPSTPNNEEQKPVEEQKPAEEQKPSEEQKPTEEQTATEDQKTDEGNTDDTDDENKSDDEQSPDDETSDDNGGSDNTDSDDDDDDENTSLPPSDDDDETSDSSDPTDSDPRNDGEDDGSDSDIDDGSDDNGTEPDGVDDGNDEGTEPDVVDDGDDESTEPDVVDDGDDESTEPDVVDDGSDEGTEPDAVDDGDDEGTEPDVVDDGNDEGTEPDVVDDGGDEGTESDVVDDGSDEGTEPDVVDDGDDEGTESDVVDDVDDEGTDSDSDNVDESDGIDSEPSSDEVIIEDNEVPLGDIPTNDSGVDNGTDEIDIFDDDVPLASNPDTGVEDSSGGLALGAAGAAIAMGVAAKLRKKK